MQERSTLDIIVDLLGLAILLWLFWQSISDLSKGNKERSLIVNLLLAGVSLIYSLKILLRDLLDVV